MSTLGVEPRTYRSEVCRANPLRHAPLYLEVYHAPLYLGDTGNIPDTLSGVEKSCTRHTLVTTKLIY